MGSQRWTFPSVVWTPQGQVASLTYPSGRVVTTSFDLAGRVVGVAGTLAGSPTTYVSTPSTATQAYAAHGGLLQWSGGDGLTRTMGYNARLQTTSVIASPWMSLGLNWAANGNLTSQTVSRYGGNLSATQSYYSDGVNRLCVAAEAASAISIPSCSASLSGNTWQQWYTYDNVGNRAVVSNNSGQNSSLIAPNYTPQTSAPNAAVPFNSSNQWNLAAGYDAAGNTTSVNTQTMVYDAESRMTSWTDSSVSGSTVTLTYDGDGRRITKTSNLLGTTTYVYDPAGNLAVEVGGSSAIGASTAYLTTDHLGSVRLVTSGPSGACLGAHDYLPFGEEIPGSWGRGAVPCYPAADTQTDTTWKFGGQERDAENGFDNFLARHLGSSMGRFFSVDPGSAGANPGDPQSWNGYTYGSNSPLVYSDPTGTDPCINGTNPNTGNLCATGTAVAEGGPDSGSLFDLSIKLIVAQARLASQVQQALAPVVNAIKDFRQSSSCANTVVNAGTAAGVGFGTQYGFHAAGSLAFETGGAGLLTAPAIIAGSGAAGGLAGHIAGSIGAGIFCNSNAGPSGGGRSDPSASDPDRPKGVPDSWKKVPDRAGKGGFKYADPNNPNYNYVRVRTDGTITQVRNGQALDVNGNPVGMSTPQAHFPEADFVFRP